MEFLTDPGGWWIRPFVESEALRNALAAVVLTTVCTSLVGTWVVLRGLSFLGDALAHGVLPGVAIAFVLGFNTTVGAFVAAIVMVGGVNVVRSHSPLPDDASIGILFVGFLALAVVIMSSQRATYSGDLDRFLFGSVTGVTGVDLLRQSIAALVTAAGVVGLHRALLISTFDERQATIAGLRPRSTNVALLVLVAVAIVTSFSTVGNLLVFAFLVAPPATATLVVRRIPAIMAVAVAVGTVCGLIGLLVSYHHGTAAGATMALTTVSAFMVALLARSAASAMRRRVPAAP